MVHGLYFKTRPKSAWQLVSVTESLEVANIDLAELIAKSKQDGNEFAEGIIQDFDSSFYIPEILHKIKEQKSMYN